MITRYFQKIILKESKQWLRINALIFALSILVLLGLVSCKAPDQLITVVPVDAGRTLPQGKGIFYSLPQTVLIVDVVVNRKQNVPGPFAEYSDKFLGLANVNRSNATTYSIADMQINSFSEPDPHQVFFVSILDEIFSNNRFSVSLTESGMLQSIHTPYCPVASGEVTDFNTIPGTRGNVSTFNYFIDFNLPERVDTVLERVQIDTLVVTRQTLRRSFVEKPVETRAREVAEHILTIRNKRFAIISGYAEIPYSREALEYMYTELGKQEDEYIELFTGVTIVNQIRYRYTFVPNPATSHQPHTLFFFSERQGVVPTLRRDAFPVLITTERNQMTRTIEPFVQQADTSTTPGVIYTRIPEYAAVTILMGNTPRARARMLINQFGTIVPVPIHQDGIKLYPNTGSLNRIGAAESQ